jgi:hypothetical protein
MYLRFIALIIFVWAISNACASLNPISPRRLLRQQPLFPDNLKFKKSLEHLKKLDESKSLYDACSAYLSEPSFQSAMTVVSRIHLFRSLSVKNTSEPILFDIWNSVVDISYSEQEILESIQEARQKIYVTDNCALLYLALSGAAANTESESVRFELREFLRFLIRKRKLKLPLRFRQFITVFLKGDEIMKSFLSQEIPKKSSNTQTWRLSRQELIDKTYSYNLNLSVNYWYSSIWHEIYEEFILLDSSV